MHQKSIGTRLGPKRSFQSTKWYFPWDSGPMKWWDKILNLDKICLCLPATGGTVLIAVLCIIYGLVGLLMVISMLLLPKRWEETYINREDLQMFLLLIFVLILSALVFTVILVVGMFFHIESLVLCYLWCCIGHVLYALVLSLGCFVYCGFVNNKCFMSSGWGVAFGFLVLWAFYALIWMYIALCVNSYRVEVF